MSRKQLFGASLLLQGKKTNLHEFPGLLWEIFKEVLCVKKNAEILIFLNLGCDHGRAKSRVFRVLGHLGGSIG